LVYHLSLSGVDDSCCYGRLWYDDETREKVRVRGIVYALILLYFGSLQIISLLKASFTNPGNVPKAMCV
jgi:hypothetical protein